MWQFFTRISQLPFFGPLICKRTWGGLIGISTNPGLIDGGNLVLHSSSFCTTESEWPIKNEGVAAAQGPWGVATGCATSPGKLGSIGPLTAMALQSVVCYTKRSFYRTIHWLEALFGL